MAKLDVKALGFSLGIVWGVCTLLLGLSAMCFNYGAGFVSVMSSFYIGYKATVIGSVIGGIWGFFDAGIGGVIIAWLYNRLAR